MTPIRPSPADDQFDVLKALAFTAGHTGGAHAARRALYEIVRDALAEAEADPDLARILHMGRRYRTRKRLGIRVIDGGDDAS